MALQYPVMVLVGNDPVRRRQLLARLKAQAGDWQHVSAADVQPLDLLQPNLLCDPDRPLVRVLSNYPKWTAAQRKQLAKAAGSVPDGVAVVIVCDKLGDKDPIRGALAAEAIVESAAPQAGRYLPWIERQAELAGVSIQRDAAQELLRRVGERNEQLASELSKLAAASDGQPITVQLVGDLVAGTVEVKPWDWADAMIDGERAAAMRHLAACEQVGDQPLALTAVLHGRLINMAFAHAGLNAQTAGVKPYPWRIAQQAAHGAWPADRVKRALVQLVELEAGLRGGSMLPPATLIAWFTARPLG